MTEKRIVIKFESPRGGGKTTIQNLVARLLLAESQTRYVIPPCIALSIVRYDDLKHEIEVLLKAN